MMYSSILDRIDAIALKILYQVDPDYLSRSVDYIKKSLRDIKYSVEYTIESLSVKEKSILINYYLWLIETLSYYQISYHPIQSMFYEIISELSNYLSQEDILFLQSISFDAIKVSMKVANKEEQLTEKTKIFFDYLIKKERMNASEYIIDLVKQNVSIEDIYLDIIQPSMVEIGRRWQNREIGVADEHMATVITQYVMTQLYPYIFSTKKNGKKLIGLALGDELHEIGIRMITDLFEYHGYETHYLGANMPNPSVIRYLKEVQPDLLALSVTLSTHLSNLQSLINDIRLNKDLNKVKIIIGGQALNFVDNPLVKFKADGFALDGRDALKVGDRLVRD